MNKSNAPNWLCPICGSALRKGKRNFYCSAYKTGCKFSVPFELCKKKLSQKDIELLIFSKRTNIIKGFISRNGKSFDAALKISKEGKLTFVFPNETG